MAGLCIVSPYQAVATNNASAARLARPDPKEAVVIPNNGVGLFFEYDFGAVAQIDSIYLGFHYAAGGVLLVQQLDALGGNVIGNITNNVSLLPLGLGVPTHTFFKLATPYAARYVRITINGNSSGAFNAGVVAFGLAFQPQWGQEYGAGRTIEDTGTAERLFGGGWGIDDGVAATGYQWTFGDIQPEELRRLYQLMRDRRTTRSVLVVEDPDQTVGLNERVHWGLFRKIDAYERLDPLNTKWSLQVADWA